MFVVYGKSGCPACDNALRLLKQKGFEAKYLKLGTDYSIEELRNIFGENTNSVPQIARLQDHALNVIGGFNQLMKYKF